MKNFIKQIFDQVVGYEGLITGGVKDKPDERDFKYSVIFGDIQEKPLPKKCILKDREIQDQSLSEETKYSCVYFASSSASNILNNMTGGNNYISGTELSFKAKMLGWLNEWGSYLIYGPKLLKRLLAIDGFVTVSGVNEIKRALVKGQPVLTGSKGISWTKSKIQPYVAVRGSGYPHAFIIVGYSDSLKSFLIEQSYGEDNFKRGYMYIKYDDIDLLFTCYAISKNSEELRIINEYMLRMRGLTLDEAYGIIEEEKDLHRLKFAKYALQLRFIGKINKE